MYLPEVAEALATTIPTVLVMDKVRILLMVVLISLGLLFAVALAVSLVAAVVQVLSFLLPPSIALPTSVSILDNSLQFILSKPYSFILVPAVDRNRNNYNNNHNGDDGENRSNRSLSLWLGRLQMGVRELPAIEHLEPFVNFANISNDSPANQNSESTLRRCLIDLEHLSLDGYRHPNGQQVQRQIPDERGDSK